MIGKCPDRGTILLRENGSSGNIIKENVKLRCPSCTNHFHYAGELTWVEE